MIIFAFLALGLITYNQADRPQTVTTKEIYEAKKKERK